MLLMFLCCWHIFDFPALLHKFIIIIIIIRSYTKFNEMYSYVLFHIFENARLPLDYLCIYVVQQKHVHFLLSSVCYVCIITFVTKVHLNLLNKMC